MSSSIMGGPLIQFFEESPPLPPVTKAANLGQEGVVHHGVIDSFGDLCEDIIISPAAELTINDNNEPVPKSIQDHSLCHEIDPNTRIMRDNHGGQMIAAIAKPSPW